MIDDFLPIFDYPSKRDIQIQNIMMMFVIIVLLYVGIIEKTLGQTHPLVHEIQALVNLHNDRVSTQSAKYTPEQLLQDQELTQGLLKDFPVEDQRRLLNTIGEMYLYSDVELGILPNTSHSMKYLEQSASLGNPNAQHLLSSLYATGILKTRKQATGRVILMDHFASMSGNIGASLSMGYRSLHGYGVAKSCETALRHYKYAADQTVSAMTQPLQVFASSSPLRLSDDASLITPEEDAHQLEYLRRNAQHAKNPKLLVQVARMLLFSDISNEKTFMEAHNLLQHALDKVEKETQEHASVSALLGHMYQFGMGVEANHEEAIRLYSLGMNHTKPEAEALNGLGLMYLNGKGLPINIEKAMELFGQAATQGHAEAVYNAGLLLLIASPQRAIKYFQAAAQVGHLKSLFRLARIVEKKRSNSREVCWKAVDLYKQVAERHPLSMRLLKEAPSHFAKGEYGIALKKYLLAAEMGYEIAESNVVWMLHRGYGFSDMENSTEWKSQAYMRYLRRAVAQKSTFALVMLADVYYYGLENQKIDVRNAVRLYEEAAEKKNPRALFNMGYLYEHGIGVAQSSFARALEYYTLVATHEPRMKWPMKLAMLKIRATQWFLSAWENVSLGVKGLKDQCMSWALCTHIFGREEDAELHQEDVESEESYKHTISEPIGENLEEKNEIPTKTTPTKHPKILAASMSFGARSILQICLGATLRTCSNKMAVEGWVKVGAPPTSTSMQWVRQDKCFSIDFVQDQNTREFKIHASFGASDDDAKIYSAPILQMGRWSYISVVRKSEVVYISVNGSLITKGTITVTDRVTEVSNIVQVGSYIGRDRFFHGDMAHLRIWSDWKSQEELVKMKRWSSEDRFTRNLKLNLQYNIQKSDSNQKARLVNNVLPIVEEEHQRSLVSSGIGLKMTILPPMDEP